MYHYHANKICMRYWAYLKQKHFYSRHSFSLIHIVNVSMCFMLVCCAEILEIILWLKSHQTNLDKNHSF